MPDPTPTPSTPSPTPTQTAPTPSQTATSNPAPVDEPKPDWPADWRQKFAGDNAEAVKTLERFAAPPDMWKAYQSLRLKMSNGELKSPPPKDATPEQMTAWRAENGIPEKADGYQVDDLALGEPDKEAVRSFAEFAHGKNLNPETVKAILTYRREAIEKTQAAQKEEDAKARRQTEDALRTEWGGEYRRNMNLIDNLLDSTITTDDLKQDLKNVMATNSDFAKWLIGLSLIHNPTSTVLPNASGNLAQSIDEEIAKIEKTMRENRKAYNADEAMQARYRDLLDAREHHRKRAA